MNETNIDTFYLLDLDRTLFDTVKSTEVMRGVVALHDRMLAADLEQQFAEYSVLGESFSMRDFIINTIGEHEMEKIEARYHEVARQQNLLLEGATELMAYIDSLDGAQRGILTYGSPLGQAMKIAAAKGLEGMPFLVTSETFKGGLISSWRKDDGLYHLPEELGGYRVRQLVFVDDKPFSFKGLPIDCRGYLVKSVFDAGIEKLPTSVTVVDSLNDVLVAEKHYQA